jgi:hypothetical protein
MWCNSAVNLTRLSRLAVSRMPSIPFDAVSRLGVRPAGVSPAFPLAAPLPSTASAEHSSNSNEACPLFGGFSGTMGASDFSPAWMAGLRFPFSAPSDNIPSDADETSQLLCKQLPDCSVSPTAQDHSRTRV